MMGIGSFFLPLTKIIHPDIYIITLCRVFVNYLLKTFAISLFCTKHDRVFSVVPSNYDFRNG